MKKIVITSLAMFALVSVSAQDLAMPSDSIGESSAKETRQEAKYNTPSESYKAERNAIRQGNKYFEQEKYHQALEEYDKALQINSGSIRGRYNKAVALLQLQSDDNKGTKNDPRVQAANLFGEIVNDAKNYDKDIAEKALYNLGNIAFNDENYDLSIEMYKASLRVNPDNMKTRENLRLAQLKKQEQEQNQDQQNQQDQQEQQQQQEQQEQQQQEQQQQQQPQEQPMTQSAQQILQSMQNKENSTRKKVKEQEPSVGRPKSDKPW